MERLNLSLSDLPVLRNAVFITKKPQDKTYGSNTYEITERWRNYIMKPVILLFA